MQLALAPAPIEMPTFADLAEDYNIRHGLASPQPLTAAVATEPVNPTQQQRFPGGTQEPFSAAVQMNTALGPPTLEKPEQMQKAPQHKTRTTPGASSHAKAVEAMGSELRKMHVEDATIKEEGELPDGDQDSCGFKSSPKLRGNQHGASSAQRPCAKRYAHCDRGRSTAFSFSPERNRHRTDNDRGRGTGARRMNLTGSFSPERRRRRHSATYRGRCCTEPAGCGRKRARSDSSPGFDRGRSRCGASERGRRMYALYERPPQNDRSRMCDRGRSPVRSCKVSHSRRVISNIPVPPEAPRPSSPSNASASSCAISLSQPMSSLKSSCSRAGNKVVHANGSRRGQGGNLTTHRRCTTFGAAWNPSANVRGTNQVRCTLNAPVTGGRDLLDYQYMLA